MAFAWSAGCSNGLWLLVTDVWGCHCVGTAAYVLHSCSFCGCGGVTCIVLGESPYQKCFNKLTLAHYPPRPGNFFLTSLCQGAESCKQRQTAAACLASY